jgi:hypothetical protein
MVNYSNLIYEKRLWFLIFMWLITGLYTRVARSGLCDELTVTPNLKRG